MSKIITRKQWIAALKSGEYKQTKSVLRDTRGFCCIGVAASVACIMLDENDQDLITHYIDHLDKQGYEISLALGLNAKDERGNFILFEEERDYWTEGEITIETGEEFSAALARLNDNGYTFEQIADLLIFDTWMNGWEQEDDQ